MKTIAIIFNGTHLPYHVIHHAIEKAKQVPSEILALFLKGKHESSLGYIFPSDIATTEIRSFEKKALSEDENIILDNMEVTKQMVEDEKIPYRSILKTNVSIDEVIDIIAIADSIVVDDKFDNPSSLKDNKITLKLLNHKISKPVDMVPAL